MSVSNLNSLDEENLINYYANHMINLEETDI